MRHPAEARRCQNQRQGAGLPKQGGRGIDLTHVSQDPGPELQLMEGFAIPALGALVLGGSVDVVEDA